MFKMLKSKIALILAVIVAVCSASSVFSVSADEVYPSLSVNSAEITAGDTGEISIDIKVKNFSKVVGLQLYINYGELELLSATSNCINLSEPNYSHNNSTGNFSLAKVGEHTQGNDYISGFTATDDETTLLTLTFEKPSSAAVSQQFAIEVLEKSMFCNNDENPIIVTITNGKIIIKASYTLGDINNDGRINAKDAVALSSYVARTTTSYDQMVKNNPNACDINNDGRINAKDAVALSSYVARTTTSYDHYFK